MNRVLALAPIAFLAACGCSRDRRPAAPPPSTVALELPRWTLIPLAAGDRPDVLIVDWSAQVPGARRVDWEAGRALVLGGAPREASFQVFRRTHFEWLVPGDVEALPEQQAVGFLRGAARDVDVRYGRLARSMAELVVASDLAELLQTRGLLRTESGILVTR